jgi:hypothetical protein
LATRHRRAAVVIQDAKAGATRRSARSAGALETVKTVSIIQSNYIPWKGYFDIIGLSDAFIILDTVQFTKNDWRNRNRIKVAAGQPWLTIPVKTGGRFGQTIAETEVADASWAESHWSKLSATYRSLPGFALYGPVVRQAYEDAARETHLSAVNRLFLERLCGLLGIQTPITDATAYPDAPEKSERVLALCEAAGATRYLSGPAAKSYLDEAAFAARGIDLAYMDYGGYPEYEQVNPPFDHGVSVLDLLFCAGEAAPELMKFADYRRENPWREA